MLLSFCHSKPLTSNAAAASKAIAAAAIVQLRGMLTTLDDTAASAANCAGAGPGAGAAAEVGVRLSFMAPQILSSAVHR